MITLEALLHAAQTHGLLINKLGEFEDGWWRADIKEGWWRASVNRGEQF